MATREWTKNELFKLPGLRSRMKHDLGCPGSDGCGGAFECSCCGKIVGWCLGGCESDVDGCESDVDGCKCDDLCCACWACDVCREGEEE